MDEPACYLFLLIAEELMMGTRSVTVPGGLYAWTKQFLTGGGGGLIYTYKPQPLPPSLFVPWRAEMAHRSPVMPSTLGQRGKGPWKIRPVFFKHVNSSEHGRQAEPLRA